MRGSGGCGAPGPFSLVDLGMHSSNMGILVGGA